jgi:YVTN family beta-propeller protein
VKLAIDPTTNTVYVTTVSDNVLVIDGATNTLAPSINVGTTTIGIAVDPATDTVYATSNGPPSVLVIDGKTKAVTAVVALGVGAPEAVAVDSSTDLVYVVNDSLNTVSVIEGGSPVAPSVSSVAPSSGPVGGGTAVTITGSGFIPASTVVVGEGRGPPRGRLGDRVSGGRPFPVWFFEVDGETIGGATARTLVDLLEVALGIDTDH